MLVFLLFIHAYKPSSLRLSNHINAEHRFWLLWFRLQVFRQAAPPQRVDCFAPVRMSVKCLSQGHNIELPVRESNREPATF